MVEEVKIAEAAEEIKNASEEDLRKVIEDWYERARMEGLKMGAKMISAVIYEKFQKHLKKKNAKPSLRDYQRCVDDILQTISVQLTQQNDLETAEVPEAVEEVTND
jgi:hypothetical protein